VSNRARNGIGGVCLVLAVLAVAPGPWVPAHASAGINQPPPQAPVAKAPPPIEKLSDTLFRIGQIQVDTASREISLSGKVNDVTVLEFVANTRMGMKAYESALTLDTDAITFNAALLLIGLDPTHAQVPTRHFDPAQPKGDSVEIWIDLAGPPPRRLRAERLLYDRETKQTIPDGPWVYTGSTFLPTGPGQSQYLAEADGVLIGFIHSPAPIIENPRGAGIGQYGSIVLNPDIGLVPLMPIKLTVKALNRAPAPDQPHATPWANRGFRAAGAADPLSGPGSGSPGLNTVSRSRYFFCGIGCQGNPR
jgi:hypothetical protein